MRRRTFVVGRFTGRSMLVLLLGWTYSPSPGPWTIRAIISTN
jgi:hypothetical protein